MKRNKRLDRDMLRKGFHRLEYDEIRELTVEFGVHNLGCGYMREFYYNARRKEMIGMCYFKQDAGLPKTCRVHIPSSAKNCAVYQNWLRERKHDSPTR